jgi:isocitrate/isopropylmalate dehydrogenase
MEIGDEIITGIQRSSNYQFTITEKKIAAPLFAAYGQNTSKEFVATFENENAILLGNNGVEGKLVRVDL